MNLATEPWIPVVLKTGEHRLASLEDVFHVGDEYADLAVRPHERIALMRLLICVAQAALDGPADIDAWDNAPAKMPRAVALYLEHWRGRFGLFDKDYPFLQFPTLKQTGKATPVTKLNFSLATGEVSTLFDHGATQPGLRSFTPGELVIMLLTYLNFSPCGLIAQVEWNGEQTAKSAKDAPCIPGSMYHTFVRGGNLSATIHANTLTKVRVHGFYGDISWGRPVWEDMPKSFSDANAVTNATMTYLGRLVPLSRLVLLKPDGETMLLGCGFKFFSYPVGPREPSSTAVAVKDERRLLGAGNKEVWRELPALISLNLVKDFGGALTLYDLPENTCFDIYVGALIRKSKQAEVLDVIESVLYVSAETRSETGMATYKKEVSHAERMGGCLYSAVATYNKCLGDDWDKRLKKRASLRKQFVAKATQRYWTGVEKLRPLLISHIDALGTERFEETGDVWRRSVHGAAREAYQRTCGQESARQIRAFALGWAQLFAPASTAVNTDDALDLDSPEDQEQEA